MQHKGDFKHSKSEAESRLVGVAQSMDMIDVVTDVSICFSCGIMQRLTRGEAGQLYLPSRCGGCELWYSEKFQYCVPDLILHSKTSLSRHGVVFVNEEKTHGKNKVVERDRRQIELLREFRFEVFVIDDSEIFNMKDSSLRVWLYGATESLLKATLPEALYAGEKEYRCLND